MNPQAREDVIRRCFAARAARREKGLAALFKRKRRLYRAMCPSFGTKRRAGFAFLTIKKTGLQPGFAASYRCSVCCCTWRLIASKLSALMTCSIRHASSAAVDFSTPSAASQSDKKVCRS